MLHATEPSVISKAALIFVAILPSARYQPKLRDPGHAPLVPVYTVMLGNGCVVCERFATVALDAAAVGIEPAIS